MRNKRKVFTVVVALLVGALHFAIGPHYQGPFPEFMSGYLIDILLPFSLYFLFTLPELPVRRWIIALAVFLIGFTVETLQYFSIPVFGSTFDPLDYVMYALGVVGAYTVDHLWISKLEGS